MKKLLGTLSLLTCLVTPVLGFALIHPVDHFATPMEKEYRDRLQKKSESAFFLSVGECFCLSKLSSTNRDSVTDALAEFTKSTFPEIDPGRLLLETLAVKRSLKMDCLLKLSSVLEYINHHGHFVAQPAPPPADGGEAPPPPFDSNRVGQGIEFFCENVRARLG